MPIKIERSFSGGEGKIISTSIERSETFPVHPAEAITILNLPRTTLFRYDGPDITRTTHQRGKVTDQIRVYNDSALLRIALETGRVDVLKDPESGRVCLIAPKCRTLLGIPWEEITQIPKRAG